MQKAGGMRRDISDKTLVCQRTESYWGKKNGTRERTRVPEAAGSSSGEFNWGISWDLELVFKMY